MCALGHDHDGFELIETTRWTREEGLWLLDYHLERLQRSAEYFGFNCDLTRVRDALEQHAASLDSTQPWRVRMTLARDGIIAVTSSRLMSPPAEAGLPIVTISKKYTDSRDIFLRHKTTNRRLYDIEFSRAASLGCVEVLFRNRRGEMTEGSRTNLFVQSSDSLLTPPLRCGLLEGTLRRSILLRTDVKVEEAVIKPEDLKRAEKILIGNSVMGLVAVRLLQSEVQA
ncbi:MAG TPA: aminotransferase class IV [Candidatus Binataceae bacterium]|nr:aminotransferase class IV [Candidatus Binataceae bacterium]